MTRPLSIPNGLKALFLFAALVLLAPSCGSSSDQGEEATAEVDETETTVGESNGAEASTETSAADGATEAGTGADDGDTAEAAVEGGLPDSPFLGDYEIVDADHGAMVTVTVDGDTRTMMANGLPNHEVGEFPNSGNPNTISEQDVEAELPLSPVLTGQATAVKEPGVTVAGVKFDPGTAERATCTNGTTYSIEAIQDVIDLGLDYNNAHVQPTGAYHYHGASDVAADALDSSDEDLVHIGFMFDGHLVYYSRRGAYQTSYVLDSNDREGTDCAWENRQSGTEVVFEGQSPDGSFTEDWVFDPSAGDLDECNGIEIGGQYVYLITEAFPYISRCLMGEVADGLGGPGVGGQAPPDGGGLGPPPGDGQGPPPGAGPPPPAEDS